MQLYVAYGVAKTEYLKFEDKGCYALELTKNLNKFETAFQLMNVLLLFRSINNTLCFQMLVKFLR